jgi:hypothetical protein
MLPSNLTSKELEEKLRAAYVALVGGEHIMNLLFAFHHDDRSQRKSLRALAIEHDVHHTTIREWILTAHRKLRQAKAMPAAWEQRSARKMASPIE